MIDYISHFQLYFKKELVYDGTIYTDYTVNHFEGNLHTKIGEDFIIFEKCEIQEKNYNNYERIEWNHVYDLEFL